MKYYPIALFVYNRLSHTKLTVEALQKNYGATESPLFIFSDGPKNDSDVERVKSVRNYISTIGGFVNVKIIEREYNYGLAKSIVSGVTSIISMYGSIVVVEDDIVTSPFFLRYINDALNRYQHIEKVMHIAGYMFPIDSTGLGETFFYRNTSCWGWGTWQRAWEKLNVDALFLKAKFSEEMKYRFNIDGVYDAWSILERQCCGKADSWAIKWYASVFLSGGLCLHPSKSLVQNIGHDGSGIHCKETQIFNVNVYEKKITEFENIIIENRLALSRIKAYMAIKRFSSFETLLKRIYKFFLHRHLLF